MLITQKKSNYDHEILMDKCKICNQNSNLSNHIKEHS